jgi:hypothetical protein
MPVYLCQPGVTATEPWRHGIHVYAAPFELVDQEVEDITMTTVLEDVGATMEGGDVASSTQVADDERPEAAGQHMTAATEPHRRRIHTALVGATAAAATGGTDNSGDTTMAVPDAASLIVDVMGLGGNTQLSRVSPPGIEIRRIRHAEVVLVDDICVAFGRHWLRLRWPGHKGGFAGYVALGKIKEPLTKHVLEALQGTVSYTLVC